MKATVFVDPHGDPYVVPRRGLSLQHEDIRDLDIAPEFSFKLTLWALQSIMANSRCHASRQTARTVLEEIARTGEVEVDSRGLPASVKFPGKTENRLDLWRVG